MMTSSLDVTPLLNSWIRALKADGKSPRTVESYVSAVEQLDMWCIANGRPTDPAKQTRAVLQDYIAYLIERRSSGTAGVRYRSLRQWFRWLASEDEAEDVMKTMSHPKLEEKPVAVITDDHLRALLNVTKGPAFYERRDHAIFRLLIDTGMRRGELAALNVTDVDLDAQVVLIQRSKTGRGRLVPIGTKTAAAIDRYLRVRQKHRHAVRHQLWLGLHGPLTGEGVRQMLMVRCTDAGVPHLHPHQFRHTAAHRWLLAGGQEQDLARIAGWAPGSAILGRYGASAAEERPRASHRRLAPGDTL